MKKIVVPYIENLGSMSAQELSQTLERFGARDLIDCAPWAEFPYKPDVSFELAADDSYLFVKYNVNGLGLRAEFERLNEPVWQDSCVEIFVADPDGGGYRNFEVNCIGTMLSSHQRGRGIDVVPISEEAAKSVKRFTSKHGRVFPEQDGEHEWTVVVGIPFELLGYRQRPDELRANLYKCADASSRPHYLCWSPISTAKPDFHRPEFFGTLILEPKKQ